MNILLTKVLKYVILCKTVRQSYAKEVNMDNKENAKAIAKKSLNASVTVRLDEQTKHQFEEICNDLGLSISAAISAFVNKVVNVKAIPFNMTTNKAKRKIGIANGKYNFDDAYFDELDKDIIDMFGE